MCEWARLHPDRRVRRIVKVQNEGATVGAARLEGIAKGFPDYLWPVRVGGRPGLALELKRTQGGRVRPEQREWLAYLQSQGWAVAVALGCGQAVQLVARYLSGAWDRNGDAPV